MQSADKEKTQHIIDTGLRAGFVFYANIVFCIIQESQQRPNRKQRPRGYFPQEHLILS